MEHSQLLMQIQNDLLTDDQYKVPHILFDQKQHFLKHQNQNFNEQIDQKNLHSNNYLIDIFHHLLKQSEH